MQPETPQKGRASSHALGTFFCDMHLDPAGTSETNSEQIPAQVEEYAYSTDLTPPIETYSGVDVPIYYKVPYKSSANKHDHFTLLYKDTAPHRHQPKSPTRVLHKKNQNRPPNSYNNTLVDRPERGGNLAKNGRAKERNNGTKATTIHLTRTTPHQGTT